MPRAPRRRRPSLGEEVGWLITLGRRLVWRVAARSLAERGESMLTWQVLSHLREGGRSSQREIAEAIGQHPAGVSRVIEELEQRGLARRSPGATDRRQRAVELTAAGRRFYASHHRRVWGAVEEELTRLSLPEQRALRDLLRKLLA